MGRVGTGSVLPKKLSDGTSLRAAVPCDRQARESVSLHERPHCECGCGGGWNERAARRELSNVLARVRAGVWKRDASVPAARPRSAREVPTFHEYASQWLRRADGVLGDRPLEREHAPRLPLALARPPAAILRTAAPRRDRRRAVPRVQSPEDARVAGPAGRDRRRRRLRDDRNRRAFRSGRRRSASSSTCLAAILDDAIEDGHIERNPARTKRMRVRVPKPQRSFLELDELGGADRRCWRAGPRERARKGSARRGETAHAGRRDAHARNEQAAIADRLGSPKRRSTGTHDGCPWSARRTRAGRSSCVSSATAASATASYATSVSARSACRPGGARFHIPDAKTETGVRVVEMSPDLAEAFVAHLDRLRRTGNPTGPRRLRRAEPAWRPHQPPAHRRDHPRSPAARKREGSSARSPAAPTDDATQPAPHLHLDRAARQRLTSSGS